jgi:p-aminobenzoyl-glutamate transporter AbgT
VNGSTGPAAPAEAAGQGFMARLLNAIERGGNKMPHPAILFPGSA